MNEVSQRNRVWQLMSVVGGVLLLAFLAVPLFNRPFEDAAILYQYSSNLAHTGVISFIPHGPRAEGATDFLWMVYLAAFRLVGIPSYGLAIATNAACAVLLAWLLVKTSGRRITAVNLLAVTCLLLMAPQMFAAAAGFGIYTFAFLFGAMAIAADRGRYGTAVIAGMSISLLRADGVLFAGPVLAIYLFQTEGIRERWWKFLAGFVLPGLIYFVWRWHYFGHLLPLPFYVKSDTPRIAGFLVLNSAKSLLVPLVTAAVVLAFALCKALLLRRNVLLLVALMVPSTLFYMMMRLDQNYANRFFFYPLLVMAVMLALNYEVLQDRQRQVVLGGLGVWVLCLGYFWVNWAVNLLIDFQQPQVVAVARDLANLTPGSMIVTESGVIPYYSQWAAYDPWGLNTPAFAVHLIQPADVTSLARDLVIVHQDVDPVPCGVQPGQDLPHQSRSWRNMTQNVIAGVNPAQYTQWLLPQYSPYYRSHPVRWDGTPRRGQQDYQCWFIRNDYRDSVGVMETLKRNGGLSAEDYVKAQAAAR